MTRSVQKACMDALNDLIISAQAFEYEAKQKGRGSLAHDCARIARGADAARTRLLQDGDEYQRTAWAVLDTSRIALADAHLRIIASRGRHISLDCRDGVHRACDWCHCDCHAEGNRP